MVETHSEKVTALGRLRRAARLLGLRNPLARTTPTNWQVPPATRSDIDYQVEYAISNGRLHVLRLQTSGIPVNGARVLEIGPGIAFGGVAYLRAAGADVSVTDRWLAAWSDAFHGPVYSAIADRLESETGFDVEPIRRMVADKGYVEGTIRCLSDAGENLSSIVDGRFDALVSNAVLEHIKNPAVAFAEFFRVTRRGGVGLHQVDYRDHRNFNQPLEHLLLEPSAFEAMNDRVHSEYGSQRRHEDYSDLLRRAGFLIESYESNDRASDEYLDALMKRLEARNAKLPPGWTRDSLSDLGGLFWLRKP